MSDTLITVIAIFLAAIVMFVFPVMYIAKSNETISQSNVQALTNDFVNTARTTAKITKEDYDAFIQKLNATGNKFDVEMEVQVLDENPKKVNSTTIGENLYYSVYTNDIESELSKENSIGYKLNEGDVVRVTVKNTNKTMYQMFMTAFMGTNSDTAAVEATSTGVVTSTGAQ